MRIVFCGTPEFAVPSLRALLANPEFAVEAVITQPDRPRGRGQRVSPSPVKEVAAQAGVRIYQPASMKSDEARDFIAEIKPDTVVIIAYGQIIPRRLLDIPRLGWMNLHGSLLPKYRGAAPIAWAIINGEPKTGLTTMRLDPAPLVSDSLIKLNRAEIMPIPQDSTQASYAPILTKEHGRIDWSLTSGEIHNRIRGLAPWPGAYSTFRGRLCQIWGRPSASAAAGDAAGTQRPGSVIVSNAVIEVVCGKGTRLQLEAVQLEGRKRISAREFVNGARLASGENFGG
jgi:methionyl-tRNA formyltransferase